METWRQIASTYYRSLRMTGPGGGRERDNGCRGSKHSVSFDLPCRNVRVDPLNVTVLISNTCRWLSRFMSEGRRSALLCLTPRSRTKSLLPVPIGLTLSSILYHVFSLSRWVMVQVIGPQRATKAIYNSEGWPQGYFSHSFPEIKVLSAQEVNFAGEKSTGEMRVISMLSPRPRHQSYTFFGPTLPHLIELELKKQKKKKKREATTMNVMDGWIAA
ncbi:hypothetical protein BDV40DRAFT_201625 [Aspergillus tamarii]|uniref:Uncharacterized protein n=1 Tax=Aspergillus tamarii TaxID=41984 RepID=A0A5N6UQK7_ASPTM|nr:hypothetical protein BDV40DRAFT_201625 [Aspergillus tamarii]